jgi:hypothetical protein
MIAIIIEEEEEVMFRKRINSNTMDDISELPCLTELIFLEYDGKIWVSFRSHDLYQFWQNIFSI